MRPYIICHMGTSIDGRLHPSRFTAPIAGTADVLRGLYEKVHDQFGADGWIIGRKTLSEMAKGTERPAGDVPKVVRTAHLGARGGRKLAIGIDPCGRAHYGKDNIGGDHAVAVLGEQVSDAYLAELRDDGVSYIFAGPQGKDLPGAMEQIASLFGAKTLLLEGGGTINGAFLKHKLIDEFSTLIRPADQTASSTTAAPREIVRAPGNRSASPIARCWKAEWCGCATPWNASKAR